MSADKWTSRNSQICAEAAAWLVEFRTGDIDAGGRRNFDAWVRASPEHIRAFIEMAALWKQSGAIDPRRQVDVDAILARVQSGGNVIALSSVVSGADPNGGVSATGSGARAGAADDVARRAGARPRRSAWASKGAIAAALLVAALTAALTLGPGLLGPPVYTTGVRARRRIRLPDGTRVVLDSRSRLRVEFTAAARQVQLLRGQALFYVVKNSKWPFLVHAGNAVVRDVGTVFDVNRRGNRTLVTVVEGRVAVATPSAAADAAATQRSSRHPPGGGSAPGSAGSSAALPVFLSGGEQVDMRLGRLVPRPVRVNVTSVTAWTHGEVVLESATLKEVAQVFNRYSSRKLVAEDLGSKPLHLSGIFATNPAFLIKYLRERPDIVVTETDSEIDIVRKPGR